MKPLILLLTCLLFLSCHKKSSPPLSGIINTVAGGGKLITNINGTRATSCALSGDGIATDNKGNFYFINERELFKVNPSGIIYSIAGRSDSEGYAGDRGPATNAIFKYASKIAVDGAGNIYIADGGNNRIRKIDNSGIIYTIAGVGAPGYTGDGGPATTACIDDPSGVAVDDYGNVFITEFRNNCVRKIDASGMISTLAGNGTGAFSGDGGPASNAQLWCPAGIAVDKNGNVYICDAGNSRFRKIDVGGTISSIVGGNVTYSYQDGLPATRVSINPSPYGGVCVDAEGNVYLVDAGTMHIRKVNHAGIITNFAGNGYKEMYGNRIMGGGFSGDGGPATNAELDYIYDVAVDATGNVYIADYGNNRVRKVNK